VNPKASKQTRVRLPRRLSSASDAGPAVTELVTEGDTSKAPADSERGYEVGYGRPPKHTRFKPGQSGNPKGRTAQSRNVKTIVTQVLDEPMSIREGNRVRKVTRFEALVRMMTSRAFKGDQKAFSLLTAMMRHVGYGSEVIEHISELPSGVDHEAVLKEYLTRYEPEKDPLDDSGLTD